MIKLVLERIETARPMSLVKSIKVSHRTFQGASLTNHFEW
jgi:hypothetical protein